MSWGRNHTRYDWGARRRGAPPYRPARRYVDTPEGRLAFNVEALPWALEGRRRGAYLDGQAISDDELELRLAELRRSA